MLINSAAYNSNETFSLKNGDLTASSPLEWLNQHNPRRQDSAPRYTRSCTNSTPFWDSRVQMANHYSPSRYILQMHWLFLELHNLNSDWGNPPKLSTQTIAISHKYSLSYIKFELRLRAIHPNFSLSYMKIELRLGQSTHNLSFIKILKLWTQTIAVCHNKYSPWVA